MSAAERKLLLITGPTASGKSDLAFQLASRFPLRLISADSMQVYRGMDIGTSKPPAPLKDKIALIDVADPGQPYSAGHFMRDAIALCETAWAEDLLPCVCGGSGLYIRALVQGLVEIPAISEKTRFEVESMPLEVRVSELSRLDPESASKTELQNPRRVSRALEVLRGTGKGLAAWQRENHAPGLRFDQSLQYCLNPDTAALNQRIQTRNDAALSAGWAAEAKALARKYGAEAVQKTGAIGYAELLSMSESEARPLIELKTRQYARRQRTWFRKEPGLKWISDASGVQNEVSNFIKGSHV